MTKQDSINTEGIASLSTALAGTGNGLITPYTAYRAGNARGLFFQKQNLGLVLPGGSILRIRSANGTSLSTSNYGTVAIPSKLNPGETNVYQVTSNQDLTWSNMTNNLFGTTSGVAWGQNIRFFLYAVQNAAEDAISFMISRIPFKTVAPAASIIGTPASSIADTQGSFFAFSSVTTTDYENNPCVCLGSFYMTKSAIEVWTVNTLDRRNGFNQFGQGFPQTFPTQQFGAPSAKYTLNNGGTATTYTTNYTYIMLPGGLCHALINLGSGTGGAGAVNVQMTLPFAPAFDGYATIPCSVIISGVEGGYYMVLHSANYAEFRKVNDGTFLLNSNAAGNIAINLTYQASDS